MPAEVPEQIRPAACDRCAQPCEVATEATISLRYTQKLFTERNSTGPVM
jgi:hypothetical protein